MTLGQITRASELGKALYSLSKRPDIKNIVEIGTWSGMGSTKCVIDGLLERSDDYKFITIELYPEMYAMAKTNLAPFLNEKVQLLNGRIVNYEDAFWFDHKAIDFNTNEHAWLYYEKDMNYLKIAANVLDTLPVFIDLLILDGGEYTTYPEYTTLRNRTRIFALDDTRTLKCNRIREELVQAGFQVLLDSGERNGTAIFERKP